MVEAKSPAAEAAFLLNSLKALAGTAALQAISQVLMFAAGIVVIRNLSVGQYAWYTLATATVGVASALSDSGMGNAISAQGGRVWQQRDRLGAVLRAGLAIRRKYALRCALLLIPVLFWLTLRQGASAFDAALLCAAVAPGFFATTVTTLLEIPLRLHQRLTVLQTLQIGAGVLRFVCLVVSSLLLPVAWIALLGSAVAPIFQNWRLRRASTSVVDLHAPGDEIAAEKIRQQTARSLPATLYYVFAGQLTVLLITLYGTTEQVAQVGALGRIATIATLLLSVFQLVASPRYARIPETATRKLLRTYLLLLGALVGVCAAGVLFAWLFPEVVLFILGAKYRGLTDEVALAVAAGVLNVVFIASSSMAAVRGTVVSPLLSIPPGIALQALLIYLLPLDSVATMFWLSIAFCSVQFTTTFVVFLRRLVRESRVPLPA